MVHETLVLEAPPCTDSRIKHLGDCCLLLSPPWRVMIPICIEGFEKTKTEKLVKRSGPELAVLMEWLLETLHWNLAALGSVCLCSGCLNSPGTLLYHGLLSALHKPFKYKILQALSAHHCVKLLLPVSNQ